MSDGGPEAVLDASAVLAVLLEEPGSSVVEPLLGRSAWSAVNLCEVAGKLVDRAMPVTEVKESLDGLDLAVHDLDPEIGLAAAELRRIVPRHLSVGDRACLALAQRLGLPAVTAERGWGLLRIPGVTVHLIR